MKGIRRADHCGAGYFELTVFQPSPHFVRGKAQPEVSHALAQRFILVPMKIHDHNATTPLERAMGFADGVGRAGEMVQHHAGDDQIDRAVGDR